MGSWKPTFGFHRICCLFDYARRSSSRPSASSSARFSSSYRKSSRRKPINSMDKEFWHCTARSPEKWCQQKPARPRSYKVDNEADPEATPQYFQISVNVIEARKLAWSNPRSACSYVLVVIGKQKHRTRIRRNLEDPFYREYFVFELYMSIRDVKRSNIWLAVMEPRCCATTRLLGETSIDLGTIWTQPHHQVFQKWAQLSLPRDPAAGAVGFINVDVSIMFRGEVQIMPAIVNDEKGENNLLLSSGSEQQRANYQITVHGAFGLPSSPNVQGDYNYKKLPSTFVRVSYSGLTVNTAVQHRNTNPAYCEQISIVEMFPNISEKIQFEVCSGEGYFSKILASTELRLPDVSHDGDNGYLPTFGPSLLHMYGSSISGPLGATGENGPYHRGALLLSLKTIVPYYQQAVRSTNVEPVLPVFLDNLWQLEDFCIFCSVLEVSMIDCRIVGKTCGVAMTIGEMPSDKKGDEDFIAMLEEIKLRKLHYTGSQDVLKTKTPYGFLEFSNNYPVLQLAARIPDFRFRMYRNNMIYGILANLEQALTDVERRLIIFDYIVPNELKDKLINALDDAAGSIIKFLDIIQYSNPNPGSCDDLLRRFTTVLDQKQLALHKEEMQKIYQQILKRTKCGSTMNLIDTCSRAKKDNLSGSRKEVKILLAETKTLAQKLSRHIYKTSEGWPDIVIWILNGGSRVAFYRISPADVIHSVIPEQNGKKCGQIQTIYMKPLKCPKHSTGCYCVAAKIELSAWMGLHRQMYAFSDFIPSGYELKIKDDVEMCLKTSSMVLECRAFVYRAKLSNGFETSKFAYSFVRINALNAVKDTEVMQNTSTPIWNQVLKIHKMCFIAQGRLIASPPMVLVEVFECEISGKTQLIGRFEVQPVLDDRQSYEHAPKLQWYDVYRGVEHSGQVLMSVQLLQVPEKFMKSIIYYNNEEYESGVKNCDVEECHLETLPAHLIPSYITYKVDVYWWGLRDVNISRKPCVMLEIDELTIKSDIIGDRKPNCNFPNGRASQVFEAPLTEEYCPPLSIRLYDSNTFGRTLFLGTNVVKNPNKFLVNWIPKTTREASLRSVFIKTSDFLQVNQMLYVRKSNQSLEKSNENINNTSPKSSIVETKKKRSKWRRLLYEKESDEEENTLLPMFDKEKNHINVVKRIPKLGQNKDWWSRYFASQECRIDDNNGVDKITIYDSELEYQPEFCKFKDWCATLKLYNGKKTGIPHKDEKLYCGFLKAAIAIYRWPPPGDIIAVSPSGVDLTRGYFDALPNNDTAKFLIRVYVVKGIDLMTKDITGKSDPYIIISCGNKQIGDRNNYVSNSVNPIFGSLHEIRCILPDDYQLTVSLYDYDAVPPNELIGSTSIDLENRIYTRYRARVGLSSEYNTTGSVKWRDCYKPSVILEDLCVVNHIPPPIYPDVATVVVNGVEYKDVNGTRNSYTSMSERKENTCLSILHKWETLPICGHHLVPEHIETRTLWNPDIPGVEQGKLQMWVDIFPLDAGLLIPSPVDITPRKLKEYELRVIIRNVQRLQLIDSMSSNLKKVSDIYIKVWIGSVEQAQYTDINNKSDTGDGNNWRMVFSFQYQHAERKILLRETGPFTEVEERILPILVVQVIDSDADSQDEYLASLALNLNNMPRGVKYVRQCTLDNLENCRKVDLFSIRSIRAWWPLNTTDRNTESAVFAGVVDMEMTLLPKEKAILMPVSLSREPSPLPKPKRRSSSNMSGVPILDLIGMIRNKGAQYLIIGCIVIILLFIIFSSVYISVPIDMIKY